MVVGIIPIAPTPLTVPIAPTILAAVKLLLGKIHFGICRFLCRNLLIPQRY